MNFSCEFVDSDRVASEPFVVDQAFYDHEPITPMFIGGIDVSGFADLMDEDFEQAEQNAQDEQDAEEDFVLATTPSFADDTATPSSPSEGNAALAHGVDPFNAVANADQEVHEHVSWTS